MTFENVKIEFQSRLNKFYDTKEIETFLDFLSEDIGISKIDIRIQKNIPLSDFQNTYFFNSLQRLEKEEPIQYIRGKADFFGYEFTVSPSVLIPRQETELLVDSIIKENKEQNLQIVDLGTGSGCIAICLAKLISNSKVIAIDISLDALEIAKKNALEMNVSVEFVQINICNESLYEQIPECNIIVSNPPYICTKEQVQMENNVLNFEPHLALFVPNSDPLLFYKAIAKIGLQKLQKNGKIYCEINEAYGNETLELFEKYGYTNCRIIKDLNDKNRFVVCEKGI
jgi:release factor glutamine methyltransferase